MATAFSRTREESAQYETLTFALSLNTVTAADVITDYPLDFHGTVEAFRIIVDDPVVTASDAATFAVQIGSTAVSGLSIATASADFTPRGKVYEATPTPGANDNVFRDDQAISVVASAVTDYAEGTGTIHILLKRAE